MKFTKSVVAAAVTSLVLPLAACSGSGSGSGSVNLVFRQFDPKGEVAGLTTAIDAWNKSHPKIHVEMQILSPNNVQQFAREAIPDPGRTSTRSATPTSRSSPSRRSCCRWTTS
jgi:multiple sugar transport system substrate-binding protein